MTMNAIRTLSFLRQVLVIDAVSAGAMGVALWALAGPLGTLTNLPEALLAEAGLVLFPFAAFVGYLASRSVPPRIGVWIVIALNVVWAVDSLVLLVSGWVEPNLLGHAFVIGQAVVVAVLAELEYVGLRRSAPVAA
jgi:hypothetical protein